MQSRSTNGYPHECTHEIHNCVGKFSAIEIEQIGLKREGDGKASYIGLPFVGGSSKQIGDQLHGCINEETNKYTGCNDFRIRTLFLIQVPRATDTQKITTVAGSIKY